MKNKNYKKSLILLLVFAMVLMYGVVPKPQNANAVDSISNASDTISDSDMNQVATHTFDFDTTTTTPAGGTIEVELPAAFGTIAAAGNVTCPGGGVASLSGGNRTAICTYAGGVASGTKQIVITAVTNPSAEGSQYIEITNRYTAGGAIKERVTVAVAIIDDVLMTARVESTLTFTVSGTSSGAVVNGITCDNTTTATATPFGTLIVDTASSVCQTLNVQTNAQDGYTVTVEQDNELLSDSGANINSFDNSPTGTGSSTAHAWVSPANLLDQYHTYGHMGFTSNDADLDSLGGGEDFLAGGASFVGFNDTDPFLIMHHDGPSDNATQNVGRADILYRVEIASLQEAGDYENTLTYICTPTY